MKYKIRIDDIDKMYAEFLEFLPRITHAYLRLVAQEEYTNEKACDADFYTVLNAYHHFRDLYGNMRLDIMEDEE